MNTHHRSSFGDEAFDLADASTSTPTSSFVVRNPVIYSSNIYQQTPPSSKHMFSPNNTSDEYHTANAESFNVTSNNSMNNSIIQQSINTASNVLPGGHAVIGTSTTGLTTMAARKQMASTDQNEPSKPLSAYALFFRDTVSAIKQQNPTCSFQELSKIVASMWDALDPMHKGVYNKKNEMARTEYLKQIRIYQQQQQLKQDQLNTNSDETLPTETNAQQQTTTQLVSQPATNNVKVHQNNVTATTTSSETNNASTYSSAPSDDQITLLTEADSEQKCTRENCNKRAIINPDWEDEYCSNECVIIHCRNVFNAWVQSNLEAKVQQQQQQQPTRI